MPAENVNATYRLAVEAGLLDVWQGGAFQHGYVGQGHRESRECYQDVAGPLRDPGLQKWAYDLHQTRCATPMCTAASAR
jgi:hypothetical protein